MIRGTLVFERAADIRSLDPTAVFDSPSIWAQEQIYETLYTVTADGRSVRPWLATRCTLSRHKRTSTFQLGTGTVDVLMRYTLTPRDGRTHVRRTVAVAIPRSLKLLQPVLARAIATESRRTLLALKAHADTLP